MESIIVRLRRSVLRRLTGEVVMHWSAKADVLPRTVKGRSLALVERRIRAELAALPEWGATRAASVPLELTLEDATDATRDALRTRSKALKLKEVAERLVDEVTSEVVAQLLLDTPALSLRDAARISGLSKSEVQRYAARAEPTRGKNRARIRARQREDALASPTNDIERALRTIEALFGR